MTKEAVLNHHSTRGPRPFDALDHEWALICRKHRRTNVVARWAAKEPGLEGIATLADLIPPAGVDRTPIAAAIARLHIEGDDLASRALLQLLIPGILGLTARWRTRSGSIEEVGWDIVSRAAVYVGQMRERQIRCSPTAYVLLSVHRDLVTESRGDRSQDFGREAGESGDLVSGSHALVASPEETVCAGLAVQQELRSAVSAELLTPEAAHAIWAELSGFPSGSLSARTGLPSSTSYRLRARAYAHLYLQFFGPESGEAKG